MESAVRRTTNNCSTRCEMGVPEAPTKRAAVLIDEEPAPSKIEQRPTNSPLWDVLSIFGLIEALGGCDAVAEQLGMFSSGARTPRDEVTDWMRKGHIPNGWHLRLFGIACARGITVYPQVFDLGPGTPAARGLYDLVHAAIHPVRPSARTIHADKRARAA